ncbi:3-oxoacyl-ACP synthase [Bizionia gelidisalsuginis]|uniref:3-oxoacyl-ACP synthase n=1 Tax=Bizionia gelidisalsuginis TaxID=291188 RepID=A0ABY3MCF7_9FLAO|nr:3-oxoacyl-ACP synthase [Bizionia gelidisalsuginis]TYC15546.1 3-oxoacyl-ACP synthase [Bizionia gelidisalsuginis]
MTKNIYIESYCTIKNKVVSLNGTPIFSDDTPEFSAFIKQAAKQLNTNYPKFFKMDNLSKLAFLTADILLKNANLSPTKEHNIALLLSNKASSLDTDRKHQNTIIDPDNYYPSPSLFVYTLPNICLGEISIKHKLLSENSFFIFERFNADHLHLNSSYLLNTNKAEKTLCGWVDLDGNNYDAFLYIVGKNGTINHNTEEITRLYNTP